MRIPAEAAVKEMHLLVQHRVGGHAMIEVLELRLGRQLAVEQQVADLEIVGVLGELVDRVAAIEQFALVAIDIGDGAVRGRSRRETRVVGEQPRLAIERSDVDYVRSH
jgi:hypothetical protein